MYLLLAAFVARRNLPMCLSEIRELIHKKYGEEYYPVYNGLKVQIYRYVRNKRVFLQTTPGRFRLRPEQYNFLIRFKEDKISL